MRLNIKNVAMSTNDQRRGITLPLELTENLAEFIGIVIGDGHLSVSNRKSKKGSKFTQRDVFIAGNKDEQDYLNHINKLCFSLFNLGFHSRSDKRSKGILLVIHSKAIVQYLHQVCEIPTGSKTKIVKVPGIILKSTALLKCAFLRGLADTDYQIAFKNKSKINKYAYPVIRGSFKSKNLVKDLEQLYTELGLRYCVSYDERNFDKRFKKCNFRNSIYINGKDNFRKWLMLIGFSNQKFRKKAEKWMKDGFCPPHY